MKSKYAFALVHFGSNIKYLELELYFVIMLKKYTKNDIIYMYSVNDTPATFVAAIAPLVTKAIGYDDRGITFDVKFESKYTLFNMLRTCNFMFAYTLKGYDKVCTVESDMVIMKNLDSVFKLKAPAALCYLCASHKKTNLNVNTPRRNDQADLIKSCDENTAGRMNGGVMLFKPSVAMFEKYKAGIEVIVAHSCKYPNESLFEYVNTDMYNLPMRYNLSHYHTLALAKFGISSPADIYIYHFNETEFKHLDILKDGWLAKMDKNSKYRVKKLPIRHFNDLIYIKYRRKVEGILADVSAAAPQGPLVVASSEASAASLEAPTAVILPTHSQKMSRTSSTRQGRKTLKKSRKGRGRKSLRI